MRIRQVKPSFWTDDTLAALPPAVRLFYVGLWMVADDGGWLRWNVPEIANELYGYESRKKRERDVNVYAQALEAAGRIERFPCGHAIVPTLTEHQRFSGATKQVHTVEREHVNCGPSDESRVPPQVPATPRPYRIGKEREQGRERNVSVSQIAQAQENDEPSDFQRRVPRPA